MRPTEAGEVLIPFRATPAQLGVATRVRTTLLVSSLQSLRRRGMLDAYLRLLPAEHRDTVMAMIAGKWVPMNLGEAHYQACEALAMPQSEVIQIGREVGDRIEGTYLGTMVRMAGGVGATPWTALGQTERLYDRIFTGGGGLSVVKLGPKDARVTFVGVPVARIPYFRQAMAGVFAVGCELFCSKAYVHEEPQPGPGLAVVLHMSWA